MDEDCQHENTIEIEDQSGGNIEINHICINCSMIVKSNIIFQNLEQYKRKKTYTTGNYIKKVMMEYEGKFKTEIKENFKQILDLHKQLECTYLQIRDPKRKKSLNVQYQLYKLLQLCGVDCKITDFKIPFKRIIQFEEHKIMWKQICDINKW
ncbi:unnamed protein product [Rotaria magnacalcarata]|uniref:Uncharacterized protein n=1 Tax=Rotaria magnacalcarata TaxID=392030 RepID=A0A816VIQ6_9BILA|nr:unnamed protein product [Rotaria magnacalcarata]